MLDISQREDSVVFSIKVQPGASRTALAGYWENQLKLKVSKKPEGGEANKECIKLLAKTFKVPRQAVRIIKGQFARLKVIEIKNITITELKKHLQEV